MSSTSRPARSISTMVSARLGIQPPGKTCLRMKNSVWKCPTWPMKCSMPRPPGLRNLACACTTWASWSRPACSSVPIDTSLSYSRLASRGVGEAQLVPPVADPHQRLGAVHAAFHPRRHGPGEVALDVELAVEIRFEQPDVPEGGDAPVRARVAEHQRERRRLVGSPLLAALGEADRERDAAALADLAQRGFDEGSHGPQF